MYNILNNLKKVSEKYAKPKKVALTESKTAFNKIFTKLETQFNESRLSEAEGTFTHLIQRFPAEVKQFKNGSELNDDLYEALYDYYLNAGEMPYGVAKNRDGDPVQWVANRFEIDLNHTEIPDETVVPLDETESEKYEIDDIEILSDSEASAYMYDPTSEEEDGSKVTINFTYYPEEEGSARFNSPKFGPGAPEELSIDSIDTPTGTVDLSQVNIDLDKFTSKIHSWVISDADRMYDDDETMRKLAGINEYDIPDDYGSDDIGLIDDDDLNSYFDDDDLNSYFDDEPKDENPFTIPDEDPFTESEQDRWEKYKDEDENVDLSLLSDEQLEDYYSDHPESMPDEYARPHERIAEMRKLAGLKESEFVIPDENPGDDNEESEFVIPDDSDDFESDIGFATDDEDELDEERDIEYANTPNERMGPINAVMQNGNDMHRSKRAYPSTRLGDNPMAVKEAKLWSDYKNIIAGVKK